MHEIGLMVVPGGNGYELISVPTGMTVAQLIEKYNLFNREIALDQEAIPAERYKTTTLDGVQEVFATGATKGA